MEKVRHCDTKYGENPAPATLPLRAAIHEPANGRARNCYVAVSEVAAPEVAAHVT